MAAAKLEAEASPETFSFAAAGWLQMYHFGVAKLIQDVGLDTPEIRFAGSSAGALASAALVAKVDFDALRDYAVECCATCRSSVLNAFKIRQYVARGIELFAVRVFNEDERVKDDMNRQLEVYMSVLPWCTSKVADRFNHVDDLEEALLASCCITPLAGMPFQLRSTGEWVCDGGLTSFQPRKGQPMVVTVSPLYFTSANVKPSVFIPAWWGLYPPPPQRYRELYDLGYNDALQFLIRTKRIDARHIAKLRQAPPREPRGWAALSLDIAVGFFFVFVLRPWALLLIYAEMLAASVVCVAVAALGHLFPLLSALFQQLGGTTTAASSSSSSGGDDGGAAGVSDQSNDAAAAGHRGSPTSVGSSRGAGGGVGWADVYHVWRNLVSLRVMLHVLLGRRVPVNAKRLERFSRLYRVFRPFL